jgi:acyl carrier protein
MGTEEKLDDSLSFADNGCDDLDVIEILINIERIAGISIPSDIEILCLETEKSIEEIFRFKQIKRDKLIDSIFN